MSLSSRWCRWASTVAMAAIAAGFLTAAAPPDSGIPVPSTPPLEAAEDARTWVVAVEPGTAEDVARDWQSRGYHAVALETFVTITAPVGMSAVAASAAQADPRIEYILPDSEGTPATWDDAFNQINAKQWHSAKGDGSGVKVAVFDVGFTNWTTVRNAGNLPSSMPTVNFCGTGNFETNVHGTGVAEIVHKVSPKAQIALVCVRNTSGLGQAAQWAVNNDYDIIQMSVNWYGVDSRNDGTGYLAELADWARSHGVVWINSAANAAQGHYSGTYSPASGWHRWSGSDQSNTVTIPASGATFHLRWNDAYGTNDHYQICWRFSGDPTPPPLSQCSTYRSAWTTWWNEYQTGPVKYPAYEAVTFASSSSSYTAELWVRRVTGTTNRQITLTRNQDGYGLEHANGISSVQAPADAASVIAVGAYDYHNMALTSYSSQGPTFDGRVKPDLVAPSHLPSSVYNEPVGFSGTSASSPVVAGVAANMLSSGYANTLTPAQFHQLLLTEFVVNSGFTPTGNPNRSGAGRVVLISHPKPFKDVDITNPFIGDIRWLVNAGVTTGYGDNTFNPTGQVSRMAMSAFLYRFAGEPPYTETFTFSDVPPSHPFTTEIGWLAASGVSTGYDDGTFRPNAQVSRMAMAAFLYRYLGEPAFSPPSTASFKDVPKTHPFFKEIEWLRSTGITTGFNDGTFRPSGNVTRQAMAAFLRRLDAM